MNIMDMLSRGQAPPQNQGSPMVGQSPIPGIPGMNEEMLNQLRERFGGAAKKPKKAPMDPRTMLAMILQRSGMQ